MSIDTRMGQILIKDCWTGATIRMLKSETLREANLRGADLRRADLSTADLRGANLREADLRGANLRWTNLRGADLCGADLRWANLHFADFRETDLRGAKFYAAALYGILLEGARLNWQSTELLAEVLRYAAGSSPSRRMVAGLILVSPDWCWDRFLALKHPERTWALTTLARWVKSDDGAPKVLCRFAKRLTRKEPSV